MRILLGPSETASFLTRLARGLAQQGADCWVLNLSPHIYYADAAALGDARLLAGGWIRRARQLGRRGLAGRALAAAMLGLLRWVVLVWTLWRIDALIFISNRAVFKNGQDLWLYRLTGKRVIRIYLGTASRPRYLSGWHHALLNPEKSQRAAEKLARSTRRQAQRVRRASRWADVVVENPLCGHFQTRPFVNCFRIGFPHDEAAFGGLEPVSQDESGNGHGIRILHCPSNPEIKGTQRIEAAIEQLEREGVAIRYTRITGMPHAEVLRQLRQCDLVIDELYSDSPMAGFATEAAAFGKPVLVCGYGWEELSRTLPEEAMPPILQLDPDDFEKRLRGVIENAELRKRVGEDAYAFVNGCWSQEAVIGRFALLLRGDAAIPADWWCDPESIGYWQGLGATQEHRKQVLTVLCREQGMAALMTPADSKFYRLTSEWLDALNPPADRLA